MMVLVNFNWKLDFDSKMMDLILINQLQHNGHFVLIVI